MGQTVGDLAQLVTHRGEIGAGCEPERDVVDPAVLAQARKVGLFHGNGAKLACIVTPHTCYKKHSWLRSIYGG